MTVPNRSIAKRYWAGDKMFPTYLFFLRHSGTGRNPTVMEQACYFLADLSFVKSQATIQSMPMSFKLKSFSKLFANSG